jgi:DNA helicase HerA-like ATPase
MAQVDSALQVYRALRESLESSVLPLATSVDGRRFVFQASLHGLDLEPGGYVALVTEEETRLGQVLALEMASVDISRPDGRGEVLIRAAQGEGAVLEGRTKPFHDAHVRPASSDEVAAWRERERPGRAALHIGELTLAPGVPFALDGAGFGRHTLLCGQSGSGKTYSLGVLLESLLMETRVRVLVLDPNSDYVGLADPRAAADPSAAERYLDSAGRIVVRSGTSGDSRLGVHFRELGAAQQAALLRLDPVVDRDEYAELAAIAADANPGSFEELDRGGEEARGLARRARNLGVHEFGLWSGDDEASILNDLLDPDLRCLVADLGSLGSHAERSLAAGAVLERLWSRRAEREPVVIVIDEAHNVCPAQPDDPLSVLTTERS